MVALALSPPGPIGVELVDEDVVSEARLPYDDTLNLEL